MQIVDRAERITILANEIAENAAVISQESKHSSISSLAAQCVMLNAIVKRRDDAFNDQELFSQPVWEMLIQIFFLHLSGDNIPVSKICEDSHLPMSTARRWLQILERKSYIVLDAGIADSLDERIQLTDHAIAVLSSVIMEERVA